MRVIGLDETGALDPAAVGHKAANLARFAASFRVPPAFCLSTSVFAELARAMEADGPERELLRDAVADGYARLASVVGVREPRVAVRSSASAEDGAEASFAGQHETILNVQGAGAVLDAVLECWRSADNERVRAYRREKGITAPAEVAVLVQRMVDAEVSAIAFGVDPVSGDASVVVIDAARGLGDRIASGEITPERYTVRKTDLVVDGPVHGALDDVGAREIAKLTLALERENGHPVDVECAFAGGDLYLLQCRPITTLAVSFPVEWPHPEDALLHWRRDDAHHSLPVPRLVTDYNQAGPAHGMRARAEHFDAPTMNRLEPFRGRVYGTMVRRVHTGDPAQLQRAYVGRVRAYARSMRARWEDEFMPALTAHYDWCARTTAGIPGMDRGPLGEAWDALWPCINDVWRIHMFVVMTAFLAGDELAEVYRELVGGRDVDAYRLTQARTRALHALERDLYVLATLRRSGDAEGFDRALRAFLMTTHGNLGNSNEDTRNPSWRDEPALLVAEVDRRIAAGVEDPDARRERLLRESDAIADAARAILRDRPADLARFEEVLTVARDVAPLTEDHNYHIDRQMQAHARRFFIATGAWLAARGQLAAADDVWLLHRDEVSAAIRSGDDLRPLATQRAAEYASWLRLRHPRTLGAPQPPGPVLAFDLLQRTRQEIPGVIAGVPASPGVRRGRARVVRHAADFDKMRPGDVLVCPSSNVSWVPLFTIAAAVVTDVGGALSHAAVVAREFGVPAVTGCGAATETLRDGQLVEVDGDRGTVRPLD